ncbi:MAG: glucose-1-phosphate cytidylyltransferase [Rhodothermia bacterium]|nr:glucose-1-phosphate cytidylyltransferase [Rhodothermia bacterium]
MKVVILAGGRGSRLSEETDWKPKPMVTIGDKPILWHIMMHYYHYGINEFVIAVGYKGEVIKRYIIDFATLHQSITVNIRSGELATNSTEAPDWTVHVVDTGLKTRTGGRLKKLESYVGGETFMMTWGDGVSDVNLSRLLEFHRSHGRLATMTIVRPPARYGHITVSHQNEIMSFSEKPQLSEGWINGAFFVLEPGVFEYIDGDVMWEHAPLENLASDGQLMAYRHTAFWQCMDTIREKRILEELWESGNAPWRVW